MKILNLLSAKRKTTKFKELQPSFKVVFKLQRGIVIFNVPWTVKWQRFSISLYPSSLCSAGQVHDYFCMTVAASVNSKQKQIETMCRDKLERMLAELTWKMHLVTAQGYSRDVHGTDRIGNNRFSLTTRLSHRGKPELQTQKRSADCQPFTEEEVHQKEEEFWLNGTIQVKERSPAG